MPEQKIDRDKPRTALRRLRHEEIHYLVSEAVDMLPAAKLQRLVKGCFDLAQLRPEEHKPENLLQAAKRYDWHRCIPSGRPARMCDHDSAGVEIPYV